MTNGGLRESGSEGPIVARTPPLAPQVHGAIATAVPAPEPRRTPRAVQSGSSPRRSWLDIRWRQFRNAPRPVFRAVAASLVVASVLGVLYLAYDLALSRGAQLPGGDLRVLAVALDVLVVVIVGSFVTWLVVPLPRGSREADTRSVRTPWSAALGLFAAVPIAYLVLVVATQILKPLLI